MLKKQLTRRELIKLGGVAGLATALAACAPAVPPGSSGTTQTPTTAAEAPVPVAAEPVSIAWWNSKGGLEVTAPLFQRTIDEFNAANPGIVVEQTTYGGSWDETFTKLTTSFASGVGPDICTAGDIVVPLGRAGFLLDHREWLESSGVRDLYFDSALAVQARGYDPTQELYGVPQWVASSPLGCFSHYYEEAGLNINEPPETLDQLLEYAEKLTVRENDKVTRMGLLNYSDGSCFWYGLHQMVWAHGGTFLDKGDPYTSQLDQPEIAAAMQWYGDIDQVHKVGWEKGYQEGGALGNPHNLAIIAQFYSHNSKLPRLPEELRPKLEVLGVPVGPAGEAGRKIPVTVEGDSVGAKSKSLSETLKFFDYLNNTSDFVAKYCEIYAKEVPRSDLLNLPHLQDRRHKAWADLGAKYGDPGPGWHPKWTEIRAVILEAQQRVVINYEKAVDVLVDAHKDVQLILDDWKAEGGQI